MYATSDHVSVAIRVGDGTMMRATATGSRRDTDTHGRVTTTKMSSHDNSSADDRNPEGVWYFAYGSNMASTVMNRRGVTPLRAHNAIGPSHVLVFDVFGVPYSEPAMAGIARRPYDSDSPPVHGVAYLLAETDYTRILVSEGAGVGYREVGIQLRLLPLAAGPATEPHGDGPMIEARTLMARFPFQPNALPSARYLVGVTPGRCRVLILVLVLTDIHVRSQGLLTDGAIACKFPSPYVDYLESLPRYTRNLTRFEAFGARVFSHAWTPLLGYIIGWAKTKADSRGNVPEWWGQVVDCLFRTMWWYHDNIHSKIMRCDGGRRQVL